MKKPKLTLILGSGFSKVAGIPVTSELNEKLLENPSDGVLDDSLESLITRNIKKFWEDIFGYENGRVKPSLEEHFTMLDLSANSGHNLGCDWPPKKLRAIRRMSIHRIFQMLNVPIQTPSILNQFLDDCEQHFDFSIVSLNWDIVIEQLAPNGVNYGIKTFPFPGESNRRNHELLLLKLHGSSNWIYCDNCRKIYAGNIKEALNRKSYLELDDFLLFKDNSENNTNNNLSSLQNNAERKCLCGNVMGGRLATFSYRKDFSIAQFQELWAKALDVLINAKYWLFIGYSLPQADYEFRNLLKTAQLAHTNPPHIQSIVKKTKYSDGGVSNFKNFFGKTLEFFTDKGIEKWYDNKWAYFCRDYGVANKT